MARKVVDFMGSEEKKNIFSDHKTNILDKINK